MAKNRPRVFYVLGSLEANDMGEEVVAILGRLSRSTFEPRVVALGGRDDLRERIAHMKVRVYPLGLSGPFGVVFAVWKVRSILHQMDADVVHGFGSWGGAVAAVAAPKGVGVVRSVTRPPASGTDLRGRLLAQLERWAARRTRTHFVVTSEGERDVVEAAYGGGPTSIIPTLVDLAAIRAGVEAVGRNGARVQLGIDRTDFAFVCLTPFHSESAVDELLRGVAVARRERPEIRLFLAGSGQYEGAGRWKAEELRLDDAVVFLGRRPDVDPIWAAADLVIDAYPGSTWSRGARVAIGAGVPAVRRVDGVVSGGLDEGVDPPRISGRADWFGSDLVRLVEKPELRARLRESQRASVDQNDVVGGVERLRNTYLSLRSAQ